MSKKYFCDNPECGKEVPILYDLCTKEGIKSVCRDCYYGTRIDSLCSGELAECTNCEKC